MEALYANITKGHDRGGDFVRAPRSPKFYFGTKNAHFEYGKGRHSEKEADAKKACKKWINEVWANKPTFLKIKESMDERGRFLIWKDIPESKHYYGPGHRCGSAAIANVQIRLWVEAHTGDSYGSYTP